MGGLNVSGYHAFNLLIHALAGLTLFGLARRTLASRLATRGFQISNFKSKIVEGPATAQSEISNLKFEMPEATLLALVIAVIWVVHPLQTESVTYISQRAESLMGLFYLLTLYCFIRGVESARTSNAERRTPNAESPTTNYELPTTERRRRPGYGSSLWMLTSVGACLLGALSKEIIVTAPIMVFLYDRTFVGGSLREAWHRRWRYYMGLMGSWLLLSFLMTGLSQRMGGFGQGVTWWRYALTSCRSLVFYLKLSVWPHPLVLDYGSYVAHHAAGFLPYLLVLAVLAAGLAMALRRQPVIGFAGAWFFTILAPTSSIVPLVKQPMAEHRLYLSLAAIIALVVLGIYAWLGRRSLIVFAALAVGLGWLGVQRNKDYRSRLAIWSATVAKCPESARAHYDLAVAMLGLHRSKEAILEYEAALRIEPGYAEARNNLGVELARIPGRLADATALFETALEINPDLVGAHYNLGTVLFQQGLFSAACEQYEKALKLKPDFVDAQGLPGRNVD